MQWRTHHNILCPVRQWAAIVTRILSYKGTTGDTPVSAFWNNNTIEHITAEGMTNALRAGVEATGCESLRIATCDIGTHSIRSGAAMAMYLNHVPIISIMKIGRRKSTAFLDYIRSQVEEFTIDVSSKMLQTTMFRHLETKEPAHPQTNLREYENGPSSGYARAKKMVGASHSRKGSGGGGQPSVKPRFKPNHS